MHPHNLQLLLCTFLFVALHPRIKLQLLQLLLEASLLLFHSFFQLSDFVAEVVLQFRADIIDHGLLVYALILLGHLHLHWCWLHLHGQGLHLHWLGEAATLVVEGLLGWGRSATKHACGKAIASPRLQMLRHIHRQHTLRHMRVQERILPTIIKRIITTGQLLRRIQKRILVR